MYINVTEIGTNSICKSDFFFFHFPRLNFILNNTFASLTTDQSFLLIPSLPLKLKSKESGNGEYFNICKSDWHAFNNSGSIYSGGNSQIYKSRKEKIVSLNATRLSGDNRERQQRTKFVQESTAWQRFRHNLRVQSIISGLSNRLPKPHNTHNTPLPQCTNLP